MIKPEQIPDEVVEATAWAMCDDINGEGAWDETPFRHRPMWRSAACAAIAAALDAWPWVGISPHVDGGWRIVLPLPVKASDRKPHRTLDEVREALEEAYRRDRERGNDQFEEQP